MRFPFELGNLTSQMLIPFSIPVIYFIRHFLLTQFDSSMNEEGEGIHNQSALMHTFMINIGYLLSGFLWYIEAKRSKVKKKDELNEDANDTTTYSNPHEIINNDDDKNTYISQLVVQRTELKKKRRRKIVIYFLALGIFNLFNYQMYDLMSLKKFDEYQTYYFYCLSISFFLIVTAVASMFVLKLRIYSHQIFSMILSLILSLSIFLILLFVERKDEEEEKNYLDIFCGLSIFIPLRSLRFVLYVLGKSFMSLYYITYTQLLFIFGVIGIILNLLINCISIICLFIPNFLLGKKKEYFIGCVDESGVLKYYRLRNIFDCFSHFTQKSIFYFVLTTFFWFIENYLIWLTINILSPCHYVIYANVTSVVFSFLGKEGRFFLLQYRDSIPVILYIFFAFSGIFIASLIFNEVIIIRLCGFEKNTALEIYRRERIDTFDYCIKSQNTSSLDVELPRRTTERNGSLSVSNSGSGSGSGAGVDIKRSSSLFSD